MAVRDQRTEALRVQIYRRMPPEQRLLMAMEMFEDGVEIVRGSIRDRHPDWGPETVEREVRPWVLPRGTADMVERNRVR